MTTHKLKNPAVINEIELCKDILTEKYFITNINPIFLEIYCTIVFQLIVARLWSALMHY